MVTYIISTYKCSFSPRAAYHHIPPNLFLEIKNQANKMKTSSALLFFISVASVALGHKSYSDSHNSLSSQAIFTETHSIMGSLQASS